MAEVTLKLTPAELAAVSVRSTFYYGSFADLDAQQKANVEAAESAEKKLAAARQEV